MHCAQVNIRLTDFGISRFSGASGLCAKEGTPEFRAPEVILCRPYDFAADIYSAGATMYALSHAGQSHVAHLCAHNCEGDEAVLRVITIILIRITESFILIVLRFGLYNYEVFM